MAKVMGAGKYTLPTMKPKEGLWPSSASVGKENTLLLWSGGLEVVIIFEEKPHLLYGVKMRYVMLYIVI